MHLCIHDIEPKALHAVGIKNVKLNYLPYLPNSSQLLGEQMTKEFRKNQLSV